MARVEVLSASGAVVGEVDLLPELFEREPNLPLVHEVVRAQLAAARAGTHSTLRRGEVRGGGRKPWRQKGTGRARHGSIRAPQWRGGGVVWGPKPRDYSFKVNKKARKLALASALSLRAREGGIRVFDAFEADRPRTKEGVALLEKLGAKGRVLVVLTREEEIAYLSLRNLPRVHIIPADQLNVYDVMVAETVVFSRAALEEVSSRWAPSEAEGEGGAAGAGEVGAGEGTEAGEGS